MNRAAAFFKWTCRADSVIIRVENIRERGIGHEADEAIGRSLLILKRFEAMVITISIKVAGSKDC